MGPRPTGQAAAGCPRTGPRGPLQASIDRQGRLVLVPSKYEPEDLLRHRPKVNRCLSLEQMEEAIASGAGRPDDREDA
jgi:hypothetical protein